MLTRNYQETGGRNFASTFDKPDRYGLDKVDRSPREVRAQSLIDQGCYEEYRWIAGVGLAGMWEMALEDADAQLTQEAEQSGDTHTPEKLAEVIVPTMFVVSQTKLGEPRSA